MRGRKPKPTALHLLRGTFRPDRHGDRAEAERKFLPTRRPTPPNPWDDLLKLPEVRETPPTPRVMPRSSD